MKVAIIKGKFYLADDDRAFGWYGYQITQEAYDALKVCQLDYNSEVDLNKHSKELDKNV